MSPTVRHDPPSLDLDVVRDHRAPAPARIYACALLALAVGLVAALVASGQSLPAPGWVLVLALPLALCMNRYVFFPNEIGVTADAAVLFAAMVAFGNGAQWLGPLLLALLVGPLDARHWGAHAWTRMAYNSGSTALVTAASLAVFVPLSRELGTSWTATIGAVTVAALPYLAVESLLGILLVTLLGERAKAAARHQLPLNTLALPLAVLGAIAGLAAAAGAWWGALLVLVPAPLVPEAILVALPRRAVGRPTLLLVTAATCFAVAVGLSGSASTLTAVAGVGVLVAVEGRTIRRFPVPALAVVALVPALVVPPAADRVVAVALVLLVSAIAGWWSGAGACGAPRWGAIWLVPLCSAAWFAAGCWDELGRAGSVAFVGVMVVALAAAAACGAPPWGSRFLGRWSAAHLARRVPALFVLFACLAVVLAVVDALSRPSRDEAALVGGACVQIVLAMALVTIRQWRFAPWGRVRDAALVIVTSIVSSVLVARWPGWPAAAASVAALVLTWRVTWPLARALPSSSAPSRDDRTAPR